MKNNNVLKKLGKELSLYRKKQYFLLKLLVFVLSFFETCIAVIMFNEITILGNEDTLLITIIGIFFLLCLFWITFYSIIYMNFYIDQKNFDILLKCGFNKKELLKSIQFFGYNMFFLCLLSGGILGIGVGLLLTWKYKQEGSVLTAGILIFITYFLFQNVLKKCTKKILEPAKPKKMKMEKRKKSISPKIMNILDISLKYMSFNIKRVVSVSIIMFICGVLISYSISMIQSINLKQYISDTWGDANYKVTLYKEGDTTGDYHILQENNPLTEEMRQEILKISGVRDVIPYYSVQAILETPKEKMETTIKEFNNNVAVQTGIQNIDENEIIISTRTSSLKEITRMIQKTTLIEYFDGNKRKSKTFHVKEIIVDDSQATTIYATKQCIERMTENLPILSFEVYAQENEKTCLKISELIKGKTLEIADMNSYVSETKQGFDIIIVGIIAIMIILIFFAISILVNSKFLNMIIRKNDFKVLKTLGMDDSNIKNIISIEEVISNCPSIFFSWLVGMYLSYITCNNMKKIGSTFWLFKPAYESLILCILLFFLMLCVELKIYKYIIKNK